MATRLFDAHCDTVLKVVDDDEDIFEPNPRTHIDTERLLQAGVGCQVFACFAHRREYGDQVARRSASLREAVARLSERPPFVVPKTAAALAGLRERDDRVGVLLAIEGGEALEGRPETVAEMHALGVRYVTLAWGDNELAGASFGKGYGLTDLGRQMVTELERHKILVDISHMSDQGVADVQAMASRAFIASHSNCRALCQTARNLTDDQIRAVAASGGVVGVTFVSGFLTNEAAAAQKPIFERHLPALRRQQPGAIRATLRLIDQEVARTPLPPWSAIADQVDHIVEVAGVEAAAFGSDFDGFGHGPAGMRGCQDYPRIIELLRQRGYSPADIDQICWQNWLRVFSQSFE